MTRGDQRERDRAKNLKKHQDKLKAAGKVSAVESGRGHGAEPI
jgi:hypothetical protein